jgi:hypothetical protein
MAVVAALAAAGVGLSPARSAQEAAARPKEPLVFEVESIRPTLSDERGGIVPQPSGGQSYEAIGGVAADNYDGGVYGDGPPDFGRAGLDQYRPVDD